ncbi:MAG: hypothetical protein GF334_12710 [Candidatus Altiarchaeales archaeon]|nr:hypothetical protein [Candidatus Altiarchaeales archaeon]
MSKREQYLKKQKRLLSLQTLGRGEGAAADKIREELEDLWIELTKEEQEGLNAPDI